MPYKYNAITGKLDLVEDISGSGDVNGPASSTDGDIALFDGTTGKLLQDGGVGLPQNDGELIIGDTAGDAQVSTITGGTGVTVTNGAGSITIDADNSGDVTGPVSSTDNALSRWDGISGNTIQDSTVLVSDDGEMTNASQPAFLGQLNTTVSNVTGGGIIYALGDTDVGAGLVEIFDQNGDFVGGSSGGATFTAPVTGRYHFNFNARVAGISTSTQGYFQILTSNRIFTIFLCEPQNVADSTGLMIANGSTLVDMDLGDVCRIRLDFSGEGGNTLDVIATEASTTFSGILST